MKVHELAKELGVASKHVVKVCGDMGIVIKSAQSNLPDEQVPVLKQTLELMLQLGQIERKKSKPAAGGKKKAARKKAAKAKKKTEAEEAEPPAETTVATEEVPSPEGVAEVETAGETAAVAPTPADVAAEDKKAAKKKSKKKPRKKAEPEPEIKIEFHRVGTVDPEKDQGLFEVVGKVELEEVEEEKPAPPTPAEIEESEREARVRALLASLGRNWEDLPGMQKVRSSRGRGRRRPRPRSRVRRRRGGSGRTVAADESPFKGGKVTVEPPLTVRAFAEAIGVQASIVLGKLQADGHELTASDILDDETAQLAAAGFDVELEIKRRESALDMVGTILNQPDDARALKPRAPVVTVMGHVDHGKTSLLDRIRNTQVAAGEFGGITQHIGAYQVTIDEHTITFVDTPGHEAFTEMRLRGAMVTDIVVLVVAADDGVMPQTVEAIDHARAAGVPIIVAANKMDLPGANLDKVKQQLAQHDLIPEDWGGDTMTVPCSAETGDGINSLLEAVLLQAEMAALTASPDRPADGFVLEARREKAQGTVADLLVRRGTLRIGDALVAGAASGRVRTMVDWKGEQIEEAVPSTPVRIMGMEDVPTAGDRFVVVSDLELARRAAVESRMVEEAPQAPEAATLESIAERLRAGQKQQLNLILKTDVQGSIEAVAREIQRVNGLTDDVEIKTLHAGVGAVTASDVLLASASGAVVIGFNVGIEGRARKTAEEKGVEIRVYRIIYELADELKQTVEGLLAPEEREVVTGHAEVRQVFDLTRVGQVAGCYVTEGRIQGTGRARLLRSGRIVSEGPIASLKRFKEDAREVREGFECGIRIGGWEGVEVGDVIEAYIIEQVKRSL